nr:MAG TPA: RimK-related lysine biosynthesis protein, Probable-dependent amine/thiol ligase family Amino-group [Caudoviricetes sp.]
MSKNPYWRGIKRVAEKQRARGGKKYGSGTEDNPADIRGKLTYIEENLLDVLMYCEWMKTAAKDHELSIEKGIAAKILVDLEELSCKCPRCRQAEWLQNGSHQSNRYCGYCGQRLLWDANRKEETP